MSNIKNLWKKLVNTRSGIFLKKYSLLDKYTKEYLAYFDHLFGRAANANGFDFLCTILRVEGITSGHWDAFVEAEEAAMDFSKLLRKVSSKKQSKRAVRLALFLYCHSTEMSAPYEILANLLLCCHGKPYRMYPFGELVRVEEKKGFFPKRHLPSPKKQIEYIKKLAAGCDEVMIGSILDGFFHHEIRNAFYHSDYAITEDEFRIVKGGDIGKEVVSLEELSDFLTRCFAFYSAFFISYNIIKKNLAAGDKFHRWPNYEVLEILSDKDGLTGFKTHFPNDSYAMFERKKYGGTMGRNLMCLNEGVQLHVGDLEQYQKANDWRVDGKTFDQYGTRYNRYGYWKPIIFRGNSDVIERKAFEMSDDKIIQGCLFYIFATGHKAVEFVLKSNKKLFKREGYSLPYFKKDKKIIIKSCGQPNNGLFVYDGTIYLQSKDKDMIQNAVKEVDSLMDRFKQRGAEIEYRFKYQFGGMSPSKKEDNKDGSFSIAFSMDDPRNTLVASSLDMFPKSDWKIKEGWI